MLGGSDTKPVQTTQQPTQSTSGAHDSVTMVTLTPAKCEDDEVGLADDKQSAQIRAAPVTSTTGYSVVKVEEKHGPMYLAIPTMPLPMAVLCCLFNIVLPGVGTLMSAFTVFSCGWTRMAKPCRAFGYNILAAVLQMVTFVLIVGWIWSIRWGMIFVQHSLCSKDAKNSSATPYYVRRQSSVDRVKQHSHQPKV